MVPVLVPPKVPSRLLAVSSWHVARVGFVNLWARIAELTSGMVSAIVSNVESASAVGQKPAHLISPMA